jgi:hypothetical protein
LDECQKNPFDEIVAFNIFDDLIIRFNFFLKGS